jgi:hypothetical protein
MAYHNRKCSCVRLNSCTRIVFGKSLCMLMHTATSDRNFPLNLRILCNYTILCHSSRVLDFNSGNGLIISLGWQKLEQTWR